ncbi:MAG: cation transporter dimerization domain-containing protein [Nitrosopumilaceae archaeon]
MVRREVVDKVGGFDRDLSIEKVHDLTSEIEQLIRAEINNAVITIHPEPV